MTSPSSSPQPPKPWDSRPLKPSRSEAKPSEVSQGVLRHALLTAPAGPAPDLKWASTKGIGNARCDTAGSEAQATVCALSRGHHRRACLR